MGKLNIAHHKSYHPYRRDNIERVRRDEEEARRKEAQEEGRMMLADSEARIDLLRERAGLKESRTSRKKDDDDDLDEKIASSSTIPQQQQQQPQPALTNSSGHINLFEDLEQSSMAAAIQNSKKKKSDPVETDKGIPLAPSSKDLNPWYSSRKTGGHDESEVDDERRKRDMARQAMQDPLTSISRQLASSRHTAPSSSSHSHRPHSQSARSSHHHPQPDPSRPPEVNARLTRESSERQRALDLIRRKKREMLGSETPSTVHGGGYEDVFNKREVEEAHRGRERRDRDRDRDRGWGGGSYARGSQPRRW